MDVANWDDSHVVFQLKGVKVETEGTRKHIHFFFIIAFLRWFEV